MSKPDLVWLVHETYNEPLRYSIRSVAQNCVGQYNKLWIVGVMPDWLSGVGHITCERKIEKYQDIRSKIAALCSDDRLTEDVVIMNDDYYAVKPIENWSTFHMGPTSSFLETAPAKSSTWFRAIKFTANWMREWGYGDILCYEGHVPLYFNRQKLKECLEKYPPGLACDYPGFYPAAGVGGVGVEAPNAKVKLNSHFDEKLNSNLPWLSSNDEAFGSGTIGEYVRSLFLEPCKYERHG